MSKTRPTLEQLERSDDFIDRHIGPRGEDLQAMLDVVGAGSLDDLIDQTVPKKIRLNRPLDLPPARSERETISYLRKMMERNEVFVSMIGTGYYGTIVPGVVTRRILENPGWYTAYTPYQAEISQGRLEAILNFQQMICDITAMDIANASLLDEGTAAAEAMAMAHRTSKAKNDTFLADERCHPQTLGVLRTRARSLGIDLRIGKVEELIESTECFGGLVQYPDTYGVLRDPTAVIEKLHGKKALAIVASDLLALCMIKPPGEMGADVVLGSAQRFGVPMGYGGPHAAFFATREVYKRSMPGRIIGVSLDSAGRPALRMALQTREQHIRREKATSNICTAQVLLAVIAGMYAVYHGPEGLKRIARRIHRMAKILRAGLLELGFDVEDEIFFDTITVRVPGQAERIAARAREGHINLRVIDRDRIGIALDETTRRSEVEALWKVFSRKAPDRLSVAAMDEKVGTMLFPEALRRTSSFLDHPVFHLYHGETEMLRYLRRLQAKDISLDRSMIPLGSCTMKLNATTEMEPVTWRDVAHLHPFCPLEQAQGYEQLFEELEDWLAEITGFDAVSLQPNAGSQGEYTGLLVIKRYLERSGQSERDICLIPSSAHGTNPASAVLAGLRVVVVSCDENGNVDVEDLRAKAAQHADRLAALMVTYPSTHGVFEEAIVDICQIVHDHGGQVYLDGANLNAQVGVCRPGDYGADVSHINLHKTFCIPHGGGGPGMGPIGVKSHLAPFLPDHPVVKGVNPAASGDEPVGNVSAAPWGSASILPISWAYIAMMGPGGLRRATAVAILSANYVARRLEGHFDVLYRGRNGRVAHECIIDIRDIKERTGITAEDIAKRLMDFGFHAPTMSFPVAETLMIEPTESESKAELDRFCDAMIAIAGEIAEIERGDMDRDVNPLKNAPHTHHLLLEDWTLPYSREKALFPDARTRDDKYWPPVGRVDNVYGDRHLICTCPPIEDYQQAAE
ncbi:MAG: aminomethyl-transferring glycine dehydrogenase [Geminicoccaceae bacterium]|nr:aminomethyl-transferring glycine dehydrogenase [Geminicoccaceae bacterium]